MFGWHCFINNYHNITCSQRNNIITFRKSFQDVIQTSDYRIFYYLFIYLFFDISVMWYVKKERTFSKQHLENILGMLFKASDNRTFFLNVINPCQPQRSRLTSESQCKRRHDQTHHNKVANPSGLPAIPGLINLLDCHLQMILSATKQLMPDPCCLATGCSLLCKVAVCSCPNGHQCHSDSYT